MGIFYPGAYFEAVGEPAPGDPAEVGKGRGAGYSVNVGWNNGLHGKRYGDAEYAEAWGRVLMPIAEEFNPQLVIISAGFDSALGDECGFTVTPAGYSYLTSELMTLAGGKVVVVLEGGYNVVSIKHCMEACIATLLAGGGGGSVGGKRGGQPFGAPKQEAVGEMQTTLDAHKPYWKCCGKE
jgi:acetoin utilization deacetylase AcuC-like enzyme